MNFYPIIVFVHVLSAMALFAALGIERLALSRLATSTQAERTRDWASVMMILPKIYAPSGAILLLSGIYLAIEAWRQAPWVAPAAAALVIMAILGSTLQKSASASFKKIISGAASAEIPFARLRGSLSVRSGMALAVLYLMTVKPNLADSIALVILGAIVPLITLAILVKRGQPRTA